MLPRIAQQIDILFPQMELPTLKPELHCREQFLYKNSAVKIHQRKDSPGRSDGPGSDGPGFDGPGSDGPGFDGPGFDGPGSDGPGFDALPFKVNIRLTSVTYARAAWGRNAYTFGL
jgi:hypothetical protein